MPYKKYIRKMECKNMSILDKNVIDGLAYENETIIMEIYDHLDWREEYYHLSALQDKINSYLAYIESKQYEEK